MTGGGDRAGSATASRVAAMLRGGGSIAVAIAVMNLATYGFTMLAARTLGPRPYGAVASLMATLMVIGVLQLGLQATAARRISAEPGRVAQIERVVLGVTYRAALVLGLLLLLLTPVINAVLRLDSLLTASLVAVTAVPLTVMGGQAGILQGERRWLPLALVYVASGVPRLLVGTALIVWRPTETSAMIGVAVGAAVPVLVGWWALRRPSATARPEPAVDQQRDGLVLGPVLREAFHNCQALLAFFALSNVDVIVARNVLDGHDAGLYAGGLILTKAVLFLPQFVVVVAFPAMSSAADQGRALARSLVVVTGLGAAATAGVAVLPGIAMVFVGGSEYAEVRDELWVFALVGTALALLQLLVYSVLARQARRAATSVWVALAVLVAIGTTLDSITGLLVTVLLVDVTLLALMAVLNRRAGAAARVAGSEPVPAGRP